MYVSVTVALTFGTCSCNRFLMHDVHVCMWIMNSMRANGLSSPTFPCTSKILVNMTEDDKLGNLDDTISDQVSLNCYTNWRR